MASFSSTGDDDDHDGRCELTRGCKRKWLAVTEEWQRLVRFSHLGFKATTRASVNDPEVICKEAPFSAAWRITVM